MTSRGTPICPPHVLAETKEVTVHGNEESSEEDSEEGRQEDSEEGAGQKGAGQKGRQEKITSTG